MAVIGNLLLIFCTLVYTGMVNILYFKSPPRGDAAVGYAWTVIILNAAFIIGFLLVCIVLALKGSFHWVGSNSTSRFFIVTSGLLCILITTALSALSKDEGGLPAWLRSLSGALTIIFPVVLLACGFILMNDLVVKVSLYQIPIIAVTVVGFVGCLVFAAAFTAQRQTNIKARQQDEINFQDRNHQRILNEIDTCDVTKNMVFILVFTDANQSPDIREKAVAKVKTNTHWQEEIIKRLQNDWAPEAFNFLASNDVDSPAIFKDPLKKGILIQAKLIRESIRGSSHSSHFYPERFGWEVERAIRTADRFKDSTYNYLTEMRTLRAALDEPSEYDKPVFNCSKWLDDWIKENQ